MNKTNLTHCPEFCAACKNNDLIRVKNLFIEHKIAPGSQLFSHGFRIACINRNSDVVKWFYSIHNKICNYTLLKIDVEFELACLTNNIVNVKRYYNEDTICSNMFNIVCKLSHVETAKFLYDLNINKFDVDDKLFSSACF